MKKTALILVCLSLGFGACASSQQRLAAQQEKDPQVQYQKAVICVNSGLHDEALKYLQKTILLDPRHYLAHNLYGLILMMKGNTREAVPYFEQTVAIAPGFTDGHNNLGTALQGIGNVDRAEDEFRKAVALGEDYNACYNLSKIYYQKGKFDEALDYVQKSIRKYSRSVFAYNLQGLILEELQRMDDAILSYREALKIIPEELNVQYNLAAALFKTGALDKAREGLERIERQLKRPDHKPQPGEAELADRIKDLLSRIKK
jgi:tetratricopeptide (TPR) repeat protein